MKSSKAKKVNAITLKKKKKLLRGALRFFNEIFYLSKKKITLKFLEFLLKKKMENFTYNP